MRGRPQRGGERDRSLTKQRSRLASDDYLAARRGATMRINRKVAAGAGGSALALGLGLGIGACGGTVVQTHDNNNRATAPSASASASASAAVPATPQPAPAPQSPATGYFTSASALESSVADQQAAALSNAPAIDYDSTDSASLTITCTPDGTSSQYACDGSDTDGDTATGDTVTVAPDGASWSDTGMNWSGPDVYPDGGVTNYWTTPAVSAYPAP